MARDPDPPWAAVLVFTRLSVAGADDPILLKAPHYAGPALPAALTRLRTIELAGRSLIDRPAVDVGVFAEMSFASP